MIECIELAINLIPIHFEITWKSVFILFYFSRIWRKHNRKKLVNCVRSLGPLNFRFNFISLSSSCKKDSIRFSKTMRAFFYEMISDTNFQEIIKKVKAKTIKMSHKIDQLHSCFAYKIGLFFSISSEMIACKSKI